MSRARSSRVENLREEVLTHPDQLELRLALFFSLILSRGGNLDDAEVLEHSIFFVENFPYLGAANSVGVLHPADPRHQRLADAWRTTLTRFDDVDSLFNAIAFFSEFDWKQARSIGRRLMTSAPGSADARLKHAGLELVAAELRLEGASYAGVLTMIEGERDDESGAVRAPDGAAICSYELGRFDAADRYASEALVSSAFPIGDVPHVGATIKGLLALERGESGAALDWLVRAAEYDLTVAGPSMRLARRIAAAGDVSAVRAYLHETSLHWTSRVRNELLAEWRTALETQNFDALRNPGR